MTALARVYVTRYALGVGVALWCAAFLAAAVVLRSIDFERAWNVGKLVVSLGLRSGSLL